MCSCTVCGELYNTVALKKEFEMKKRKKENQETENKTKKRFNIFDTQREGKGVEKGEVKEPTLKNFFKYFGRSFTKLLNVNLMFTLLNIPIFSLMFAIAGFTNMTSPSSQSVLFGPVKGAVLSGNVNPVTMALYGAVGVQSGQSVRLTVATVVFYCIAALVIFTWGYANVGMFYVVRNLQKGEPVFMFADFKYVIKRNKRQGMVFGIIDLAVTALIIYDISFFMLNSSLASMYGVMFWLSIVIGIVYQIVRVYIYLMLITFDLSIYKMVKNAVIFAFVGIKRNFMGLLGMIAVVALNVILLFTFMPIGIVLPFVLSFAACAYIGTYAAYPMIKEIMIDPYEEEAEGAEPTEE